LREENGKTAAIIINLIPVLCPLENVRAAMKGIGNRNVMIRSNALELLDNSLKSTLKGPIMLALENASLRRKSESAGEFFPGIENADEAAWLEKLLSHESPWVVACAVHQIGLTGLKQLSAQVSRHADNPDSFVRQTALSSLERLLDGKEYMRLLEEKSSDPSPEVSLFARARRKEKNNADRS
ncbi:MAG: HEAT repeat domain-containing protein, partial [Planctomycetota bacterium]